MRPGGGPIANFFMPMVQQVQRPGHRRATGPGQQTSSPFPLCSNSIGGGGMVSVSYDIRGMPLRQTGISQPIPISTLVSALVNASPTEQRIVINFGKIEASPLAAVTSPMSSSPSHDEINGVFSSERKVIHPYQTDLDAELSLPVGGLCRCSKGVKQWLGGSSTMCSLSAMYSTSLNVASVSKWFHPFNRKKTLSSSPAACT
ncbi:hypothetical protein L2E82_45570 [Cichorium intybus]|uniref:Uncharacterized protein n=1 Tax=Cichorium intybus TaxID=13427 RepID=A0ACB8ZUB8_CICIN|nr:hypothetical protein L2E82_45570 [Cichorium intybus]